MTSDSSAPPERSVTDEAVFHHRRRFLAALGFGSAAALGARSAVRAWIERGEVARMRPRAPLAASAHPGYAEAGRPRSAESDVLRYNNFYEFSLRKDRVWREALDFALDPYTLRVDGLVAKPGAIGLEDVERLGLEERVYRFRCVEAWAMTVPWIGLPLARVLERFEPSSEARFVSFHSFHDPSQAPGQREATYPFPYYEALRIDEALHDLTLVVSGAYGKRLAPQNGAPLRLIVPWKYGYKSAKSLVRITLHRERPRTFWNDLEPDEYSWESNVNPLVPHPRWSQAREVLLSNGEQVPTREFNGYAAEVASLYA